jgi:hypothetical protein
MPTPTSARSLIDRAIRENRPGEYLCYGLAVVFVFIGIGVLIGGALSGNGVVSLAGTVSSILFWPAMREARQIRRENLAIRFLEAPLPEATTAAEAAKAIRDAFTSVFGGPKGGTS